MFKARRFAETLAKLLVNRTQVKVGGSSTQDARIKALADAGVLVPRIRDTFDQVRTSGNRAVHTHWGDVRAALSCVRACFELGVWLHRAVNRDAPPMAFVPPPEPAPDGQPSDAAERAQLAELRSELARYRDRLAEVMVHRDGEITQVQAEARARARRILFPVDRNNLGKQAFSEFDNYVTPGDGRKFTELYNLERLSGASQSRC